MTVRQRVYPTAEAASTMAEYANHERFLYNLSVEQFEFAFRYRGFAAHPNEATKSRQNWPSSAERMRQLTELRAELGWLREGCQTAQQQALRVVDTAYANWWKNPAHFRRPSFRSKFDTQGFGLAGTNNFGVRQINAKWGEVRIPKVGWVRFRLTRPWSDVSSAKSCRFTLDPSGIWHVSFPSAQPPVERTSTGAVIGIDRGVAHTLADSEGTMDHAPSLSDKESERLLRLERRLARQQKGSKRREKTRCQKAKVSATLVNRRREWVEQSTTWLVREYDVIVVEDLRITNMVRSAKGTAESPGTNVAAKTGLNRSILAQCWGLWLQRLKEKAATCGVLVVEVSARNTSRECRSCGHVAANNRKSQALFVCESCGYQRHADTNAAQNILERGMKNLGLADGYAVTARGDLGLPGSMKREALEAVA
jgi:IS605 OrfB family transposase